MKHIFIIFITLTSLVGAQNSQFASYEEQEALVGVYTAPNGIPWLQTQTRDMRLSTGLIPFVNDVIYFDPVLFDRIPHVDYGREPVFHYRSNFTGTMIGPLYKNAQGYSFRVVTVYNEIPTFVDVQIILRGENRYSFYIRTTDGKVLDRGQEIYSRIAPVKE